ncbi:unnamed protein product [Cyclocybe aegerita]|uniref:Uncharacterized protein n=1 Tax=Cyclocybe aegerita TaxID=1973307 RepID=A0A8S0X7T3_CYCAE|nr:unnamed protein product [Cyclocybe aegerita]
MAQKAGVSDAPESKTFGSIVHGRISMQFPSPQDGVAGSVMYSGIRTNPGSSQSRAAIKLMLIVDVILDGFLSQHVRIEPVPKSAPPAPNTPDANFFELNASITAQKVSNLVNNSWDANGATHRGRMV